MFLCSVLQLYVELYGEQWYCNCLAHVRKNCVHAHVQYYILLQILSKMILWVLLFYYRVFVFCIDRNSHLRLWELEVFVMFWIC